MKIVMKWSFALPVFFMCHLAHAWTLPVRGDYQVTNGFWECAMHCYHLGDDIVAPDGTEIRSIGSGLVVEVTHRGDCRNPNYGGRVLIQYQTGNGAVVALYGHLGRDTDDPATDDIFVSVGDWVTEGQAIGRAGSREENGCYVPHLHFGIHRGVYLGITMECGAWTYAGYTASAFDSSDACYCNVLDNWYDPSEFLGITPKDLHIVEGSVTPREGTNETEFTWHLSAETGLGAPITAGVFIFNPVFQREYYFPTPYIQGTARPFQFAYSGRPTDVGQYAYRFRVRTCADTVEDEERRNGPAVRARERQQDPEPATPPPPPPPPPPSDPPQEPPCEPHREICDGQDNDCDTWIDEDEFNEVMTRPCWTDCGTGVHVCDLGHWLPCTAQQPQEEVCDNRDNDCDHHTDENLRRPCDTVCGPGNEQCRDGEWRWCTAPQPREEVCNYRDDDCDGERDEGLSCQYWQPAEDPPPQQNPPQESPPQENPPQQPPPQQPPPQEQPQQQPENPPPQENPPQQEEQQPPQQQAPPENPPQQEQPQQPTETPLPAPTLNSPPDGFVREVPTGANWSVSISWNYVSGGVEYEYEIRSTATGIVEESGRMGGSFYNFYRPPSAYGERYSWKVRAIAASGLPGAWSQTRTFMFRAVQ